MQTLEVRRQIVKKLADVVIEDPKGQATALLRQAIKYKGSDAAFTQLVAQMEKSGEIVRTIKGKRTYSIALSESPHGSLDDSPALGQSSPMVLRSGSAASSDHMDYEELAAALLTEVVRTLSAGESNDRESWARRRITSLERNNDKLQRELSRAKAESREVANECQELKQKLEDSEGNLALLTERFTSPGPRKNALSDKLGAEERELLASMRRSARTAADSRAALTG
jgi:hypothetical protein